MVLLIGYVKIAPLLSLSLLHSKRSRKHTFVFDAVCFTPRKCVTRINRKMNKKSLAACGAARSDSATTQRVELKGRSGHYVIADVVLGNLRLVSALYNI